MARSYLLVTILAAVLGGAVDPLGGFGKVGGLDDGADPAAGHFVGVQFSWNFSFRS